MKLGKLILLAASAATLPAATITVTGVDFTRGGNVVFEEDGTSGTSYAGVILATYNGTNVSPLFCVDLFTPISLDTYNSAPVSPRPEFNEDRVSWLYLNQIGTVVTAQDGMAMQLAFWDIVHDNGDGIAAGRIQAAGSTPADVVAKWTAYLAASLGQSAPTGATIYTNSVITTGAPAQNLIGAFSPDTPPPPLATPEPGSLTLIGIGVALLAIGRGRRV